MRLQPVNPSRRYKCSDWLFQTGTVQNKEAVTNLRGGGGISITMSFNANAPKVAKTKMKTKKLVKVKVKRKENMATAANGTAV